MTAAAAAAAAARLRMVSEPLPAVSARRPSAAAATRLQKVRTASFRGRAGILLINSYSLTCGRPRS